MFAAYARFMLSRSHLRYVARIWHHQCFLGVISLIQNDSMDIGKSLLELSQSE